MQIRQVIKFLLGVLIFFQLTGMSKGEKTCNRAIANYAKKMKKEGFQLVAEGGSESKKPESFGLQKSMLLCFQINECLDIEKARKIVVYSVGDFLNYINSFESIKPYLLNNHFDVENVEIIVIGKQCEDNNFIISVRKCGKCIQYCNQEVYPRDIIHTETFEEAMRLVNESASAQ